MIIRIMFNGLNIYGIYYKILDYKEYNVNVGFLCLWEEGVYIWF